MRAPPSLVQLLLCSALLAAGGFYSEPCAAGIYRVKPGDSLWAVAQRHGLSVESIKAANALTSEVVRPGQQLVIPSTAKVEVAPVGARSAASKSVPAQALPQAGQTHAGKSPTPAPTRPAAVAAPATAAAPPSPQAVAVAEQLYEKRSSPAASTLQETAPSWVLEPLAAETQGVVSQASRLGVYPCVAPDPGFVNYSKWVQVAPMAHVLAPARNTLGPDGGFDVLMHFHGREPVRKEWVRAMDQAVLVAVDVGIDSGAYAQAFSDPRTLGQVLRAVEVELRARSGNARAFVRHLALSSWSAGYGAVEQILTQPIGHTLVDGVILLDGLHVGYAGASLDAERLAPFVQFAQAAADEQRFLFVSHSSITTKGYASTTETARYLTWKVGGKPKPVLPQSGDPMGLSRLSSYSKGDFHVRGFRGSSAADHCAQLALLRDVLRVHLKPRWDTSKNAPRPTPAAATSDAVALAVTEQRQSSVSQR